MNAKTNKVVRFYETGSADVLTIEDCPVLEPGAGELRIKVDAIGLNRADIMFREGQYLEAPTFPSRLGYEASGTVTMTGPDVSDVSIGDRVSTIPAFSQGKYGVYGESAIVPVHAVARYPENLSVIEGASIWMQYLTAYGGLVEVGNINRGDTVMITAASSSVGLAAIQVAKKIGAKTIAVTRGGDKQPFLLDAGADHVIVTDEQNLVDAAKDITDGHGVDLAFDPIGGAMLPQLADAAAAQGTIIEYGALAPEPTPYPLFAALSKSLTIRGYVLFEITLDPERLRLAKGFVYDGLASGDLKPLIDKTFSLDKIVAAHQYMESNCQKGKIVILV